MRWDWWELRRVGPRYWQAVARAVDEQQRQHTKSLSPDLRDTEAEARADGEASGLAEWTTATSRTKRQGD